MKRLFIIGNGFDLHHNLPTGLNDFRKYMARHFPEDYRSIIRFLEKYFSDEVAREWNGLETMLSCTRDIEEMLDEAIASSETDMDRASYWNDIQYNAGVSEKEFSALMERLDTWIDSISVPEASPDPNIHFVPSDIFLNFNYTDTLQKLYGIKEKQILYIHGSSTKSKILGHNEPCDEFPLINANLTSEDIEHGLEEDWRIEEAKEILNRIPAIFFKDSCSIIQKNNAFFENIRSYDEIVFMGWSLGEQDEIYMDEIMACVSDKASIKVVGYSPSALQKYEDFFEGRNFFQHSVSYFLWNEVEHVFHG